MTYKLKTTVTVYREVRFLKVEAEPRYWDDASVNGEDDEDGTLMPFRVGERWCPLIDLGNGSIIDWPTGTTASLQYKVCDAGIYRLLDEAHDVVKTIDGYVPDIMAPGGEGYGDYIIMDIGPDGAIADWHVILDEFERAPE